MNEQNSETLQKIGKILNTIANTQENECDCEHVDNLMEEVAELTAQGVDITPIMPEVKHHLETCDCCHSEFKALLAILEPAEG